MLDAASTKVYFGYRAERTYYELVSFLSRGDERTVIFGAAIPTKLNWVWRIDSSTIEYDRLIGISTAHETIW